MICFRERENTITAAAAPSRCTEALKLVMGLLQAAKCSGTVRRALDAAGFIEVDVAP